MPKIEMPEEFENRIRGEIFDKWGGVRLHGTDIAELIAARHRRERGNKMSEILKPCPFCGFCETSGKESVRPMHNPDDPDWYVFCGHCGARGPTFMDGKWARTPELAVEFWKMQSHTGHKSTRSKVLEAIHKFFQSHVRSGQTLGEMKSTIRAAIVGKEGENEKI